MAQHPINIGDRIENRYRVLAKIASGGMGTLYQVADEAQNNAVMVLKMLNWTLSNDEFAASTELFQQEFQLLTTLQHPHLVKVYNYGIGSRDSLYFTMEYVYGQDLYTIMRQRPLEDGIPIIIQICRALNYLHSRHIIHGDLKPANVLVAGDQVKIIDFGIAHQLGISQTINLRYYTPGYTAPEISHHQPFDHRVDLFSLGAIWYEWIVGEPPQFLSGAERLIPFCLKEALYRHPLLPSTLSKIITQLLATHPEARYQHANEVIVAVNDALSSTYTLETRETAYSYALRGHFIGRKRELNILNIAWQHTLEGQGKIVYIGGESGVGKTRLLEEFVINAELEGVHIARGQCLEQASFAYRPWREILRILIRYIPQPLDAEIRDNLAPLLPELASTEPLLFQPVESDIPPPASQHYLHRTMLDILWAAAQTRPSIIIIEDAHWADEATLEFIHFLTERSGSHTFQLCVTYRDDEIPSDHRLHKLTAHSAAHSIHLPPLSPECINNLVSGMLGMKHLSALFLQRVQHVTQGNTFFIQELVRSLAHEGNVLHRTIHGWHIDQQALQHAPLPESIHQVVQRRLKYLSPSAQVVLHCAATVGNVFWDGVLEKLGRIPLLQIHEALHESIEQELIVRRPTSAFAHEQEYMFVKPAVQEVTYNHIDQEERHDFHAQIAEWMLAQSEGNPQEHWGEMAHHYEQAGLFEQATHYFSKAGEYAARQFAHAEAIDYLSRALALLADTATEQRYQALLNREKVYHVQGKREAEVLDLAELEKVASNLNEPRRQLEVALRRIYYYEAISQYSTARSVAQALVTRAHEIEDLEYEANAYLRWGVILWRQSQYDDSRTRLMRSLILAREIKALHLEARSLLHLGVIFNIQYDFTTARRYYAQALPICRQIGDLQGEGWAFNDLGLIIKDEGDKGQASLYLKKALELIRKIGDRRTEAGILNNLGILARQCGNHEQSYRYLEDALRIARNIGDRENEAELLSNIGLYYYQSGDYDIAQSYCRQALAITQDIELPSIQGYALTHLAHALTASGAFTEAIDLYQRALALRCEEGLEPLYIETLAGLARVYFEQGDVSRADICVEKILHLMKSSFLRSSDEALHVYFTCYQVLQARQDARAVNMLHTAYQQLQQRLAHIEDTHLRQTFIENIFIHRQIMQEYANMSSEV